MNGRIYDPTLGRFLQADPFVQTPTYSQALNRYAYVNNSPLSATDPSGYFVKSLFKKINKALGNFAPIFALGLAILGQPWVTSIWEAAALGFVSGGIATGSVKGALIGAFVGASLFQVGSHFIAKSWWNEYLGVNNTFNYAGNTLTAGQVAQQIVAYSSIGGVSGQLSGGKFGHGFISAGINALTPFFSNASGNSITEVISNAVSGATRYAIPNNKFVNGAKTDSFKSLSEENGKKYQSMREVSEIPRGPKEVPVGKLRSYFVHTSWIDEIPAPPFRTIGPDIAWKFFAGSFSNLYRVYEQDINVLDVVEIDERTWHAYEDGTYRVIGHRYRIDESIIDSFTRVTIEYVGFYWITDIPENSRFKHPKCLENNLKDC